jgi:hemerythrin-like domain-containing protein
MCSYCGCEAETAIAALMADHAVIADLAYRIDRALTEERDDDARVLTSTLAEVFARHSLEEEAGLFAGLRQAGEATESLDRLVAEHRYLRPALSAPGVVDNPERLRRILADLAEHAEVEDSDLFPFAVQRLPDARWAELTSARS